MGYCFSPRFRDRTPGSSQVQEVSEARQVTGGLPKSHQGVLCGCESFSSFSRELPGHQGSCCPHLWLTSLALGVPTVSVGP